MIPIFPLVGYSQENIYLQKIGLQFQIQYRKTDVSKPQKDWFTLQGENKVSLEMGASLSIWSANLFILSSGSYTI